LIISFSVVVYALVVTDLTRFDCVVLASKLEVVEWETENDENPVDIASSLGGYW
jgi:hypothetical protein